VPDALVLYSAIACNYCHRVRAVLAAKRVAAEVVEIDLVRRPAWYREKASRGAVPLLEAEGRGLHGSAVINEYLEDRFAEPALLPRDAGLRAAARMWIAWADVAPAPHYEELLMNVRPSLYDELAQRMAATFTELEARLAAHGYDGGTWDGRGFGLVDATYAAIFERLPLLRDFQRFELPAALGRVRAWADALRATPAVRASAPDDAALRATIAGYHTVLARVAAAGARA
jgi:glutathione S-transferase